MMRDVRRMAVLSGVLGALALGAGAGCAEGGDGPACADARPAAQARALLDGPRIDDPQAACGELMPGSSFEGYLVDPAGGFCAGVATEFGDWGGPLFEIRASYTNMVDPLDAFFVGPTAPAPCLYQFSRADTAPRSTPAERYEALRRALAHATPGREVQGVVCRPAAPPPPEPPGVGIRMCRKCAFGHEDAVEL